MSVQSPYYLLGLAGLLIPVLIHLWSRRNPTVISFGSVRFLPEGSASRTFSFSLTEKLLLFLRILMLTLIVLIMAVPLRPETQDNKFLVLVDPNLYGTNEITRLTDSTSADVRFLSPGFPGLSSDDQPEPFKADAWTLVRAAAEQADCLLVVTQDRMNRFHGRRPAIDIPVQWITVTRETPPAVDSLLTYQGASGTYYVVNSTSSSSATQISRQVRPEQNAGRALRPDTLQLVILADPDDPGAATIRAATRSVEEFLDVPVRILDHVPPGEATVDWLVVLDTLREHEVRADNVLRLFNRRPGPALLETDSAGFYALNGILTPERALEYNFPAQWVLLLDPWHQDDLEPGLKELDRRHMAFDPAPDFTQTAAQDRRRRAPLTWPLWLAFFLLLGAERYLAHRRHA